MGVAHGRRKPGVAPRTPQSDEVRTFCMMSRARVRVGILQRTVRAPISAFRWSLNLKKRRYLPQVDRIG